MNAWEIKGRIESALKILFKKDIYLLQKDINERAVAHRLAIYLQCVFPEYDVDCEYNGNVLQDDGKKYICILKDRLKMLGLLKQKEEKVDKEVLERLVYPDIIIHKRDTSENLCIIEIKKSTSQIPKDYDKLKLECYTSSNYDNNLEYKLGLYIEFLAGVDKPTCGLQWYWGGKENTEEKLKEIGEIA